LVLGIVLAFIRLRSDVTSELRRMSLNGQVVRMLAWAGKGLPVEISILSPKLGGARKDYTGLSPPSFILLGKKALSLEVQSLIKLSRFMGLLRQKISSIFACLPNRQAFTSSVVGGDAKIAATAPIATTAFGCFIIPAFGEIGETKTDLEFLNTFLLETKEGIEKADELIKGSKEEAASEKINIIEGDLGALVSLIPDVDVSIDREFYSIYEFYRRILSELRQKGEKKTIALSLSDLKVLQDFSRQIKEQIEAVGRLFKDNEYKKAKEDLKNILEDIKDRFEALEKLIPNVDVPMAKELFNISKLYKQILNELLQELEDKKQEKTKALSLTIERSSHDLEILYILLEGVKKHIEDLLKRLPDKQDKEGLKAIEEELGALKGLIPDADVYIVKRFHDVRNFYNYILGQSLVELGQEKEDKQDKTEVPYSWEDAEKDLRPLLEKKIEGKRKNVIDETDIEIIKLCCELDSQYEGKKKKGKKIRVTARAIKEAGNKLKIGMINLRKTRLTNDPLVKPILEKLGLIESEEETAVVEEEQAPKKEATPTLSHADLNILQVLLRELKQHIERLERELENKNAKEAIKSIKKELETLSKFIPKAEIPVIESFYKFYRLYNFTLDKLSKRLDKKEEEKIEALSLPADIKSELSKSLEDAGLSKLLVEEYVKTIEAWYRLYKKGIKPTSEAIRVEGCFDKIQAQSISRRMQKMRENPSVKHILEKVGLIKEKEAKVFTKKRDISEIQQEELEKLIKDNLIKAAKNQKAKKFSFFVRELLKATGIKVRAENIKGLTAKLFRLEVDVFEFLVLKNIEETAIREENLEDIARKIIAKVGKKIIEVESLSSVIKAIKSLAKVGVIKIEGEIIDKVVPIKPIISKRDDKGNGVIKKRLVKAPVVLPEFSSFKLHCSKLLINAAKKKNMGAGVWNGLAAEIKKLDELLRDKTSMRGEKSFPDIMVK